MEKYEAIKHHIVENIDEEIRNEVLEIFLEDAAIAVVELKKAVESSDLESIRQYAHKIKGASLFAGAADLSNECMILEKNCKVPDFDNQTSIQVIEQLIKDLDLFLRSNFLDKK